MKEEFQERMVIEVMELLRMGREFVRVLVLAAVSFGLTEGVAGVLVDAVLGVHVDPAIRLAIAAGVLAALRAVDRELHDSGVAVRGLVRL